MSTIVILIPCILALCIALSSYWTERTGFEYRVDELEDQVKQEKAFHKWYANRCHKYEASISAYQGHKTRRKNK